MPLFLPFERKISVITILIKIIYHLADRQVALSGESQTLRGHVLEVHVADKVSEIRAKIAPIFAVCQSGVADIPDETEVLVFSANRLEAICAA